MDLGNFDLFKGIAAKMAWLTQRQNVIAQNVANAETPDYRAKDLTPFSFKDTLRRALTPERTSALHLTGTRDVAGPGKVEAERKPYEVTPSGNSVSIEEQMQKAAVTGVDYQMITTLYQKNIGLIRTAIDRGSNS